MWLSHTTSNPSGSGRHRASKHTAIAPSGKPGVTTVVAGVLWLALCLGVALWLWLWLIGIVQGTTAVNAAREWLTEALNAANLVDDPPRYRVVAATILLTISGVIAAAGPLGVWMRSRQGPWLYLAFTWLVFAPVSGWVALTH